MAEEYNTESKSEHGKKKAFVKYVICLVIFLLASVFLAVTGMILPAILTALLFCGCLYGFITNVKDGRESADRKITKKEQHAYTEKPKEKTVEEKKIISETELSLEILSRLTLESAASLEEDFSADAEKFYSSAESRSAGVCRAFRSEKEKVWKRQLTDHVLGKLKEEHVSIFDAYRKGVEELLKTEAEEPSGIYNAVKHVMLQSLGYKGNGYGIIGSEPRTAIQKCESRMYRISEEKAEKLWKPIHVLSGTYGAYCDCICFDEEMKVFFRLSPDDNYYHWGGYDLLPISEEETKTELQEEIPWHEDPEERWKYLFTDSDPEFTSRI